MQNDGPKTMNAQFFLLEVLVGLSQRHVHQLEIPHIVPCFFMRTSYKRPHVSPSGILRSESPTRLLL